MSTLERRGGSTLTDLLNRFEAGMGLGLATPDAPPRIRIEDYVEDGAYVLRAEMPGIDPDKDVDITIQSDLLTIRGERREEKKDKDHQEFHYGSFARTVPLPAGCDPDAIEATYRDGVLEVKVPVQESAPESRKVTVKRADA